MINQQLIKCTHCGLTLATVIITSGESTVNPSKFGTIKRVRTKVDKEHNYREDWTDAYAVTSVQAQCSRCQKLTTGKIVVTS